MVIRVHNRQDIEQGLLMDLQEQTRGIRLAVISIQDPEGRPVRILVHRPDSVAVLRLKFHDVEGHEESCRLGVYTPMSSVQADQVVAFLKTLACDILVVHCEAGQSRSAGVAAACALILGQRDDQFFCPPYTPNSRCRQLVMDAAGMGNRYDEEPT